MKQLIFSKKISPGKRRHQLNSESFVLISEPGFRTPFMVVQAQKGYDANGENFPKLDISIESFMQTETSTIYGKA